MRRASIESAGDDVEMEETTTCKSQSCRGWHRCSQRAVWAEAVEWIRGTALICGSRSQTLHTGGAPRRRAERLAIFGPRNRWRRFHGQPHVPRDWRRAHARNYIRYLSYSLPRGAWSANSRATIACFRFFLQKLRNLRSSERGRPVLPSLPALSRHPIRYLRYIATARR